MDSLKVLDPKGPIREADIEGRFIKFGRCVTLASFEPPREEMPPVPGSGRTPHSLGPVLRYDIIGRADAAVFIEMNCVEEGQSSEGARILGIRVSGPEFNDHHTSERGINVLGCYDVEIANMEIAGWGEAAILVNDASRFSGIPDQAPWVIFIRIHDNYIHHNQHSSRQNHSGGYGVNVGKGAFVEIFQNVFDYNHHSITANGFTGGYNAARNLILKGGGFHNGIFNPWVHVFDVHGTASCPKIGPVEGGIGGGILGAIVGGLFGGPVLGIVGAIIGIVGGSELADASEHWFNCGDAGLQFRISQNTFQYDKTTNLKIRGRPKKGAIITENIFERPKKAIVLHWYEYPRHDVSEYSIVLHDDLNVSVTDSNKYNDDTFGRYGVCDIDGDGIDDLVLMTGVTWWFSSAGQFPWSFLKADTAVLKDVQLGDVDGDRRCDVVKDAGGAPWMVSSGGTEDWKPFGSANGAFLAPLNEVRFGRFDPASPTFDRGIRPPTHAFWRSVDGFWFVTPLTQPAGWTVVESSPIPLADLRFGDFTGDGVTDVLANEDNHWSYSDAARTKWKPLNPLNYPVQRPNVFIANMDADDNVDDVLRTSVDTTLEFYVTWYRSQNGRTDFTKWKDYSLYPVKNAEARGGQVFVGQFKDGPGASILTVYPTRIGHFYRNAHGNDPEEWQTISSNPGIKFAY
jgi:hypothetical protein